MKKRNSKDHCQNCPVRSDCFQYGLLYDETGIWGGTTDTERATIKKRSPQIKNHLEKEAKSLGIYETRYSIEQYWAELREARKLQYKDRQSGKVPALGVPEILPTRLAIEQLWAELNIQ